MAEGEWRTCKQCGEGFIADVAWKRICFDCWKDNKIRSGEWRGGQPAEDSEIRRLKMQIAELESDVAFWIKEADAARSYEQGNGIPEEQLKRLLHLCHPDKHGNSPTATAITQWLLQMRSASKNRH